MKVGFFLPSGIKGGAEQLIFQLAREYQAQGHQVVLFFMTKLKANSFIEGLGDENITVYVSPAKREFLGYFILPLMCFWHTLTRKKFSLIFSSHVHLNSLVGLYRRLFLLRTEKHLARETTLIFSRFKGKRLRTFKFFYRLGYSFIPNIVCQTELMKAELIANLPWLEKRSRIIVLPNPINLKDINNRLNEPFTKPHFNYLVAAGSLTDVKGFDVLINSFSKISNDLPGIKLIILGEGSQRAKLEKLISNLGFADKIILPGWVPNVFPYFKYADCCIVSSRIEGFPNVLLQEMACNNSVVSTLCAGGIEAIRGLYTCGIDDAQGLSDVIFNAISHDNSTNRKLFDNYLAKNSIEDYVENLNKITE